MDISTALLALLIVWLLMSIGLVIWDKAQEGSV